jgi:NitT/TauT family transport system ATP-binding protein
LAQSLNLDPEDLLQIMDAATLLGFARVSQGDVEVTEVGRTFAETDILHSKEVFRDQVLADAPLVKTIYQSLEQKENHNLPGDFFLDILDEYYPADEARRQLETAIDWGRFAELFEYSATEDQIYIPSEE